MIQRLLIQNYAIIERLEINFSKHLTIITGETGAGKSILLGALGLIMGNRADTKSLYDETEKCVIEGVFQIHKYKLQAFFDEHDLDYTPEVVIRRELTPSGKSRAFVNDTPVNLPVLQQLTAALIDLHEQFDTLDIHNVSFQLRMIDALADNTELLANYQSQFKGYQQTKKQLQQLIDQQDTANRELDYFQFQLQEFQKAELINGEQEKLESELQTLNNAEDIKRILGGAFRQLTENEQAISGQLRDIAVAISSTKKFSPAIQKLYERLEGALYELEDISGELEGIAESTEYDPARIAEISDRLNVIYKLLKKHSVMNVDELLLIQDDLQAKVELYSDVSNKINTLQQQLEKQEVTLRKIAQQLSDRRKKVTAPFEKRVQEMLAQLSMEHARLQVAINELPELTSVGFDHVNFLFAPNKGSKFLSIKDVASGGELSRLTLCTKSLVASAIPLPTLIFDEIDAGVSGDVALRMGNILKQLAEQHQVIVITHSPQVAAQGDAHYFVYKKVKDERTVTNVRLLDFDERVRSIATMLSSNPPTPSAIENAKELLSEQV
ncbi:MAG: DNA repair protein RecN [Saprospiraceae bacterium]|nr:DNA repair protein RecN [Saprospiraceae bacterium]